MNHHCTDPFLALAINMIELAINDITILKHTTSAREYIQDSNWAYALSFNNQCHILHIDPDYARKKILDKNPQEILNRLKAMRSVNNRNRSNVDE